SDSKVALGDFDEPDIVPWNLRNRWGNCLMLGLNICHSHIYREGNSCADRLANHGHSLDSFMWWDTAPTVCERSS
ncbi:heat-shock protein, partial [Trifolium medium]|nr:heat-shock protein [Trifolium medium]